jgi:hypothetical protein
MDNKELTIDLKVLSQLSQVRDIGNYNMLDINGVQVEANDNEFYELVLFIEDCRLNPDLYFRALEEFVEAKKQGLI